MSPRDSDCQHRRSARASACSPQARRRSCLYLMPQRGKLRRRVMAGSCLKLSQAYRQLRDQIVVSHLRALTGLVARCGWADRASSEWSRQDPLALWRVKPAAAGFGGIHRRWPAPL